MSINETYLQMRGRVGTDVTYKESATGIPMASFRLGSTPRKFNRTEQRWEDKPTAWFTVECWRSLAQNVKASVEKGQPVYVTGRLKTKEWTDDSGEKHSRSTYIDAQSVGHDLNWGTAMYHKNERPAGQQQTGSIEDEMNALSESLADIEDDPADLERPDVASPSHPAFGSREHATTDGEREERAA